MEVRKTPDTGKKPVENRGAKWMPAPIVKAPFSSMETLKDKEPGKSPYSGGHGVGFQIKDNEQSGKKPAYEGYSESMLETVRLIHALPPEQLTDPKIRELAESLLHKMELILETKHSKNF